ncbi:MAG TPA: hypothetical protein VFV40_09695 [Nocardioides sp.]|nr:hypothetical protein [Nocardioides sp.]
MEKAAYEEFTSLLVGSLGDRPEVLGLVAVGSMASGPDVWSDHDFLVIADPDATEALRNDPTWLPHHERLVLHFRETAHGVKAVYDDGHLVEFAVFAPDEIGLALLNRTRVLLDRADITDRVAATVAGTPDRVPEDAESDAFLEGQLLTALLVGVQRHRRGEHLSGIDFVHRFALRHLLVLLARHVEADRPEVKDDLNPFRRVELAYPAVGSELGRIFATGDLEATARGLLELAARVLAGPFDTGRPAWQVVRRFLAG